MKKPVNNLDDIIYYTAQDEGVSEELVLNIHKNLWHSIKKVLSKPHRAGMGVHINKFMKIYLRESKIFTTWQNSKKYGHLPKTKKKRFYKYYDAKYYETLYNEYHRLKNRVEKNRKGKWFEWNRPSNEKAKSN